MAACSGLQVGCLSPFRLGHVRTTLLLKRLGLEDNKSPGEAVELPWGSLRKGRRTICQELCGYDCMFLRAGEWEALKDSECQSLSSFLWFHSNQRLSQGQLFSFTWIRARLYLLSWNNNSLYITFSRTKGSTRYRSLLSKPHSTVFQ